MPGGVERLGERARTPSPEPPTAHVHGRSAPHATAPRTHRQGGLTYSQYLTERMHGYTNQIQTTNTHEVKKWMSPDRGSYLKGANAQEVDAWVDSAVSSLTAINTSKGLPDLTTLANQMTLHSEQNTLGSQVLQQCLPCAMEMADAPTIPSGNPHRKGFITPSPHQRLYYFLWLVREALLWHVKPSNADALAAWEQFTNKNGKGDLIYTEPVSLLSHMQILWAEISVDRPRESDAVMHTFSFLNTLMGPYTTVEGQGQGKGLGHQMQDYFLGPMAPTPTWALLGDAVRTQWNRQRDLHSRNRIAFQSGVHAKAAGPKAARVQTTAAVNAVVAAAMAPSRPPYTPAAAAAAPSADTPRCSFCSYTSHKEIDCWHKHPDKAKPDWQPRRATNWQKWEDRRALLGMPLIPRPPEIAEQISAGARGVSAATASSYHARASTTPQPGRGNPAGGRGGVAPVADSRRGRQHTPPLHSICAPHWMHSPSCTLPTPLRKRS